MAAESHSDDAFYFQLLRPTSLPPVRKSLNAAGFDLHADLGDGFTPVGEDLILLPNERRLISTGLQVMLPVGTYGRIAARSGIALESGIVVMAGVIDRDFRGEIKILLSNFGSDEFRIRQGDRVAQLILEKISEVDAIQTQSVDVTLRGSGSFGGTGTTSM